MSLSPDVAEPSQPRSEASEEAAGLLAGEDWAQEAAEGEHKDLCGSLASAVVLREALPAAVSTPPGLLGLALHLPSEEPEMAGACLLHLPVMEGGRLHAGPLQPQQGVALPPGTAAWEAFESGRVLVWARGGAGGDAEPPYPDWRAALAAAAGGGGASEGGAGSAGAGGGSEAEQVMTAAAAAAALVTVPIAAPGGLSPLGAATFALEWEPSGEEVEQLAGLGQCLARCISHHTKALFEESLGFLTQVMPRRVVQRMLSAALQLGPLAAAAAAQPAEAAAAAAAVAMAAAGAMERGPSALSQPTTPPYREGGGSCLQTPTGSPKAPPSPRKAGGVSAGGTAAPLHATPGSPAMSPRHGIYVVDIRQKWNLEFADPGLEAAFKLWFNTQQTVTDLAVFRYFSVLLLVLFGALLCRGGLTLSDWLAMGHGVLSLVVLAAMMLWNTGWYIGHRSTIVASVRLSSASLLLLHAYLDPAFYSGSLLKGLAGSCALTLVVNSFRNRLRFSNHLLVQLGKLYLCALANAFVHADPNRAAKAYLPLPATTLVQLAAALLPSMAVYSLEGRTRREFVRVRLAPAQRPAAPGPGPSHGRSK